jgi:hypothetical protein
MKTRDLAVIGLAALGSMAMTLALLWPSDAVAKGPGNELQPVIAVPTVKIGGCTLRLRSDKTSYKAGEKAFVILDTSNPTDKVVTLEATLKMLLRAPIADTMSRAAPSSRPSRPAWTTPCTLVLAPGDTRSFPIATEYRLSNGAAGSFLLEINGILVASTSFTVAAATAPSISQARSTARR